MASTNYTVLRAALAADIPTILWGEPGIGKTAILEHLAAMGTDGTGTDPYYLEVVIGSLRPVEDWSGLPVVQPDGTVVRAPDDWVRRVVDADGPSILMLDELSTAPPATQAAMLRVARERVAGSVRLPDTMRIVAAANEADVAADGFELAAPTANRFLHLDWTLDTDLWTEGLLSGFDTVVPTDADCRIVPSPSDDRRAAKRMQVVGFLQTKPTLTQAMPNDPTAAGKAWPSSRTWTYVADLLPYLPDDATDAIFTAVSGLVGEGAATEFVTWVKHHDLPTPEQVLADPSIVDWNDRPDRVYTILTGVTGYTIGKGTKKAFDAAIRLMVAAGKAGRADAAASSVSRLYANRPNGAEIPKGALNVFLPTLIAAGLVDDTAGQKAA